MTETHIKASSDGSRIAELVELASQTTSRLEILWDEVGYTSDEKRRQMKGLIDGFRTLCENKVRCALDVSSCHQYVPMRSTKTTFHSTFGLYGALVAQLLDIDPGGNGLRRRL